MGAGFPVCLVRPGKVGVAAQHCVLGVGGIEGKVVVGMSLKVVLRILGRLGVVVVVQGTRFELVGFVCCQNG